MTTTPFGRRPVSHATLEAQASVRDCPATQVAGKWKLFRTITEARPALGVSDRSLAVLHALLSFHKPSRLLRECISLHRRDIAKMIIFADEQELDGPWDAISERFIPLARPLLRGFDRSGLDALATTLDDLRLDVEKLLEIHANYRKSNASDVQNERHIQNQNSDSTSDFEPGFRKDQGANAETSWSSGNEAETREQITTETIGRSGHSPTKLPPKAFPLGLILKACPDIVDYALRGIESWPDLVQTANLVRVTLGISPDAWNQAVETFGPNEAAIVVAAILQKGEVITSPGGYLRSLTDKARAGSFSSGPLLMGLLKANQKAHETRAG
ncbi:plasmid replication protein RepC [Phyllobacterium sp. LjRoot231]|uniref:plasmid replication protein RepC n=1 Tax=Phyllobacterium sp. LjRoot231 TaxID=3342289 RepID=UPI003ECFECB9